jgi:hypothetical protein
MNREKLIRKRNLGLVGMILALLLGLFSFKEYNDAKKALLRLDRSKLDEIYLDDENTPEPTPTAQAY